MKDLLIIMLTGFLSLCVPLDGDVPPTPSPFHDIKLTMYIHGFQEYPEQPFFLVEWDYWKDFVNYRRITADSIIYRPTGKYSGEWISINPEFDPDQTSPVFYTTMKDKVDPFTYYMLDDYYLGYIRGMTFLGFESIENHYKIFKKEQRAVKPPAFRPRNGQKRKEEKILPYSIELEKFIFDHKDFQLIIRNNSNRAKQTRFFPRDNFEKLHLFYETRFNRLMLQGQFNNQDIIDLISFVKSMDDYEIITKSQRFSNLMLTAKFLQMNSRSGVGRIPNVPLTDYESLMFDNLDMHLQDSFHDSHFPPYLVSAKSYFSGFWRAMIFSILIECFVLLALFRYITGKEIKTRKYLIRIILCCSLGTAVTISALWWVFPLLIHRFIIAIFVGELFAVGLEGVIYRKFLNVSMKNALILSFIANLVSFGSGYILLF